MILDHCSKRGIIGLLSGSPNHLFVRCFLVCQHVLDTSQTATAFQRIGQPLFIYSRLHQNCWRTFFCLLDGSFSDAVIPWQHVACFPKFHRVVCIHNFWCLRRFQDFSICFFSFHVKILFSADKIEPIEWQDFAPQQRTGGCFEIHQTFLFVEELCQCFFCKRLSLFLFSTCRKRHLSQ